MELRAPDACRVTHLDPGRLRRMTRTKRSSAWLRCCRSSARVPSFGTHSRRVFIADHATSKPYSRHGDCGWHIGKPMDKTSTTDRPGKTLTLTSTKPRVSSAEGAEDAPRSPGDAHDTPRSAHPAEAAAESTSPNRG